MWANCDDPLGKALCDKRNLFQFSANRLAGWWAMGARDGGRLIDRRPAGIIELAGSMT